MNQISTLKSQHTHTRLPLSLNFIFSSMSPLSTHPPTSMFLCEDSLIYRIPLHHHHDYPIWESESHPTIPRTLHRRCEHPDHPIIKDDSIGTWIHSRTCGCRHGQTREGVVEKEEENVGRSTKVSRSTAFCCCLLLFVSICHQNDYIQRVTRIGLFWKLNGKDRNHDQQGIGCAWIPYPNLTVFIPWSMNA